MENVQYQHRKYKEPVKGKGFRTLFRKAVNLESSVKLIRMLERIS